MGSEEMINTGEFLNYAFRFILDLTLLIVAALILYELIFKRRKL
jgi:hypothetical protein